MEKTRHGRPDSECTSAVTRLACRLLLVAMAGVPASGCSFIFSGGPPAGHQRMRHFDCSSSVAPPVVDSIFAAGQVLSLATDADGNRNGTSANTALVGLGLVMWGSSAVYGYYSAGQCKEAKAELIANLESDHERLRRLERLLITQPRAATSPTSRPAVTPGAPPAAAPDPDSDPGIGPSLAPAGSVAEPQVP